MRPAPCLSRSLCASLLIVGATRAAVADAATPTTPATQALHALFHDEWERGLRENPTFASTLGDRRWNGQWDDVSLTAIARQHEEEVAALDRLHAIARAALPPAEQTNYDLFELDLTQSIEGDRFHGYLRPIQQNGGPQTLDELTEDLRFETAQDYEDWLSRLRGVPAYLDQVIALLRQGIAEGRTAPRILMERVQTPLKAQLVGDPTASGFYKPFKSMPADLPEGKKSELQAAAREAISKGVVPAYRKLDEVFEREYLPAAQTSIAMRDLPDGEANYAFRVRLFTTTDMTPEQIHQLGLAEVKRIRGEMDTIIQSVGFKGSFAEFLQFLRTDPRFYFTDPQTLLLEYRATAKRIDPELVKLFGHLPRTPYGVRPIPEASAPNTTAAYYNEPAADGSRAGYYSVNLYKPEARPKYEIEVLTSHEAVPGHHLQLALQQELGELPEFRRYGGYTAFIEGWALYSESLGGELGLYKDPYSKFGQLTYEMWRAVRLVVDTGMHQFGWSRERAIDYFRQNAAKTELDIVNEIDRYIATPGQALAYKIGELKIKELRRRAQQALGERFDVRAFHDVVLGSGSLPLGLLEKNVDLWIAEQSKAKPKVGG